MIYLKMSRQDITYKWLVEKNAFDIWYLNTLYWVKIEARSEHMEYRNFEFGLCLWYLKDFQMYFFHKDVKISSIFIFNACEHLRYKSEGLTKSTFEYKSSISTIETHEIANFMLPHNSELINRNWF